MEERWKTEKQMVNEVSGSFVIVPQDILQASSTNFHLQTADARRRKFDSQGSARDHASVASIYTQTKITRQFT
jgi:hypothetical protein